MPATAIRADQWASFRLHLLGRAATCLSILAILGVVGLTIQSTEDAWPIALLMVFVLAMTVPYYYLGRRFQNRLRAISVAVIILELGFLTAGEYLLGGDNAILGLPLYGILVVMAATLHSGRAAYGVALLGAGSYALMAYSQQLGWIPSRTGPAVLSIEGTWAYTSSLVNAFLGLATAVVAGSLSNLKNQALIRSEAAEERLAELNRQLESRVEEAVRAVRAANASLNERNEELAELVRQRDLFTRAISHDLRSPLTAAGEALRMAREKAPTERARFVGMAEDNLGRADRMLVGLRELLRAAGKAAAREHVAVEPLLQHLIDDLRAERLIADLPVRIVGPMGEVVGSREQLAHVFRNLIRNAIEHNRDLTNLAVEVGRDGAAGFYVRDNGRGIPESLHACIFEPFRRATVDDDEGLGIGLALVEAIVTQAGGKIQVESQPGEGATFRFTWPAVP
jgi:signal transduction histidine kinase